MAVKLMHKWKGPHFPYFKVPKGKLKEWQAIIQKKGLKDSSNVCWRHFDDDDLFTSKVIYYVL